MKGSRTDPRTEIHWDSQSRQFLCCLMRFFDFSPRHFEFIFSEIARNELVASGFRAQGDVSYDILRLEWLQMRNNNSPIWHHVHAQTSFRRDGEWMWFVSRIERSAVMLGIPINKRDWDLSQPCGGMEFEPFDRELFESIVIAVSQVCLLLLCTLILPTNTFSRVPTGDAPTLLILSRVRLLSHLHLLSHSHQVPWSRTHSQCKRR